MFLQSKVCKDFQAFSIKIETKIINSRGIINNKIANNLLKINLSKMLRDRIGVIYWISSLRLVIATWEFLLALPGSKTWILNSGVLTVMYLPSDIEKWKF